MGWWVLLPIPKSNASFDCKGCYLRDWQPYLALAEWLHFFSRASLWVKPTMSWSSSTSRRTNSSRALWVLWLMPPRPPLFWLAPQDCIPLESLGLWLCSVKEKQGYSAHGQEPHPGHITHCLNSVSRSHSLQGLPWYGLPHRDGCRWHFCAQNPGILNPTQRNLCRKQWPGL